MRKYYRYTERATGSDGASLEDMISGRVGVVIYVHGYDVLKETPKGVWIGHADNPDGWRRFVRNEGRKKYAHPTREEARESFFARKDRQLRILSHQIDVINSAVHKLQIIGKAENEEYYERLERVSDV